MESVLGPGPGQDWVWLRERVGNYPGRLAGKGVSEEVGSGRGCEELKDLGMRLREGEAVIFWKERALEWPEPGG